MFSLLSQTATCPICLKDVLLVELFGHMTGCLVVELPKRGIHPACTCAGCKGKRTHPGDVISDGQLVSQDDVKRIKDPEAPESKKRTFSSFSRFNEADDLDENENSQFSQSSFSQSRPLSFGFNAAKPFLSPLPMPIVGSSSNAIVGSSSNAAASSVLPLPLFGSVTLSSGTIVSYSFASKIEDGDKIMNDENAIHLFPNVLEGRECPFAKCHLKHHNFFTGTQKKKLKKDLPIIYIAGSTIGFCMKTHLGAEHGEALIKVLNVWIERVDATTKDQNVTSGVDCGGFMKKNTYCDKKGISSFIYITNNDKSKRHFCCIEHAMNYIVENFGRRGGKKASASTDKEEGDE